MSFFPRAPKMSNNSDRPEHTSTALRVIRSFVASVRPTVEKIAKTHSDSVYAPYLKALINLFDVIDMLEQQNESSQRVTVLPPSNKSR